MDKTGRCPNCQMTKNELRIKKRKERKTKKKKIKREKWKGLSFSTKVKKICFRILTSVLLLAIISGIATTTLVYFNIVDVPVISKMLDFLGIKKNITDTNNEKKDSVDTTDKLDIDDVSSSQFTVEHPDADEYFSKNSTIISELEIDHSTTILSEDEAYSFLNKRGFTQFPITTNYSMDGEYLEEIEISQNSSIKHPIYQTVFLNDNDEIWTIILVDDDIFAYPVSYRMQSRDSVEVIISETETVVSYDSATNKFYETIPNESQLTVKKIKDINADNLNQLNFEEIGALK